MIFCKEHSCFLLRNSKIGFSRARISRFFILSSELTIQIPIRELPFKKRNSPFGFRSVESLK
ncbi:Uncharacterised protein [Segatella copri]|nr:Uncharacterised protein [Segatella copri]